MRRCTTFAGIAIVSLMITLNIKPQPGFAGATTPEIWISPISLSANQPGMELSKPFIELLVVRTELSITELEMLGIRVGKLSEEDVQKMLELIRLSGNNQYIRYFDMRFGVSSEISQPEIWRHISQIEPFISDAISLGNFDGPKETRLRRLITTAAEDGKDPGQASARSEAYQLFLEARKSADRKARAYQKLSQLLDFELENRVFNKNVGMVVDIRANVKRPTISPLSLVTIRCDKKSSPEWVFREHKRVCDDLGICRVESIATLEHNPDILALFEDLKSHGRIYLDRCNIITKMLIDGTEVVRTLPGKFTSTSSGQPQ